MTLESEWGRTEVFANNRSQFPNGQRLAEHICEDCPDDLRPTLLLTIRDDQPESTFEVDGRYVVVVNANKYLRLASPDAAVSYFARRLGPGISRVSEGSRVTDAEAADVQEFLEAHLTSDRLRTWAGSRQSRWAELRELGAESNRPVEPSILAESLRAAEDLAGLDPGVFAALVDLCAHESDHESRLAILEALTENAGGRQDTGIVFGRRARDRIDDVREAVRRYNRLLSEGAGETELQGCIEADPWLLGLEYTTVRGREGLPRGAMDFLLERADGRHDLLELKSPQDQIIEAPDAGAAPAPANEFTLSRALANAVAQVHVYRDTLTAEAATMERRYGLHQTEDPRAFIIIGRTDLMTEHTTRVLRELNKSLHRVEIVPYDLLGKRASVILENVERYLLASRDEAAGSQLAR